MLRNLIWALLAGLVMVSGAHSTTIEGFVGDGKTSISYDSATGAFVIQPDGQPVGQYRISSDSGIFNATSALIPPGGLGSDVTASRKSRGQACRQRRFPQTSTSVSSRQRV
jgi:hypothetical protein